RRAPKTRYGSAAPVRTATCSVEPPRLHRHLHPFPTRRSSDLRLAAVRARGGRSAVPGRRGAGAAPGARLRGHGGRARRTRHRGRSEEHTSELQSRENLVCRLLLEKKKKRRDNTNWSKTKV